MKDTEAISIFSPCKRVRAEFAIATVWVGSTVYPDAPVWRVWYGDRLVIDTSLIGMKTAQGRALLCGMTLHRVTRHRTQTPIGAGRELRVQAHARDGAALNIRLRLTDMSAFCEVTQPRKRKQDGTPLFMTNPPEGAAVLSETPNVFYAPSGKLVARWQHERAEHIVFFDRPGDLAVRRFNVFPEIQGLHIENGKQGCSHLFLTVPFTKSELPKPTFSDALTPAFKEAFTQMMKRGGSADDFWVMRGEPGVFAVAAQRDQGVWKVYGITGASRTLTVRLEDLWLRMPEAFRAPRYTVAITRDPNKNEAGQAVIRETFTQQPPDIRILLDLAANGGFALTFTPQGECIVI
ncbi:MAG: glycoside hydrolase family 97 C-terminal domain-containing protein [Kiritimatiellaeota bacterium]|nr:glycoside hydrolase family 97 C-terminal domain-containing protein [Kiritimatiellota bacterium]